MSQTYLQEASKKKRFLNFIIDSVVKFFLIVVLMSFEKEMGHHPLFFVIQMVLLMGGYYIFQEYLWGKTIGKYFTQTRIVNNYGEKMDFRAAVIRSFARFIPFEVFSLLLGKDVRAWHDVLSKTVVVEDKEIEVEDMPLDA